MVYCTAERGNGKRFNMMGSKDLKGKAKGRRKMKTEDLTHSTKDLNGKAKGRRKMKTEVLTRRAPRISTEKQKEEER
jgi:hypothetical protein